MLLSIIQKIIIIFNEIIIYRIIVPKFDHPIYNYQHHPTKVKNVNLLYFFIIH